ncbi:hypothetical protein O1611_g1032 [Lasiodiplodia mahajangana]|uniref:Uncharacterized protein n=1 Tax=Lasiodiplodia mahajangana TaxID=1108764 RepID=A0ACC2JYJ6_9PEZI|nr:hypothetical protein O1611_g1032 [Lasiodiplodia mahajangana]
MDEFGASKDLPSSPWAERYELNHLTFRSGNANHSMLAPEFPRIDDPKYYDRDPLPTDKLPQHSSEIDLLLLTEEQQRTYLFGAETWTTAAIRRYVRFSQSSGFISGGHRLVDATRAAGSQFSSLLPSPLAPSSPFSPGLRRSAGAMGLNDEKNFTVYHHERIQVDETNWLTFWRKRRWFDWIEVSPPYTAPAGRTWSVDDPEIWGMLSVVIELANRIMLALIADRNDGVSETTIPRIPPFGAHEDYWENYVDEFGEAPDPNASVLLSQAAEQKMSQNRMEASCEWGDAMAGYSSRDWTRRLNRLLLKTVFSFASMPAAEGLTQARPLINDKHFPYNSIILIDTRVLEGMLRKDLALGELCTLQVNCAMMMVHELMHAIIIARYLNDDDFAGNMLDKARSGELDADEPYLDGKGMAEMGRYMEQLFFGGCSCLLPLESEGEPRPRPIVMLFRDWPYPGTQQKAAPNSAFLEDGHVNKSYHVPPAWCAKILSESFWQDPNFPRKSENNFHRNPVFLVEYMTIGGGVGPAGRPIVQDSNLMPYIYPEDVRVVDDWEERIRIWESYRASWYGHEVRYENPNSSFCGVFQADRDDCRKWNHVASRRVVHDFADSFARKHLFKCYEIARNLAGRVKDDRRRSFMRSMPSPTRGLTSWRWTWEILEFPFGRDYAVFNHTTPGLLMMASMPIIYREMAERPASSVLWQIQLAPSKEAGATTHMHVIHADPHGERPVSWELVPNRTFHNVLRHGEAKMTRHTQLDYLELVDDVIRVVTEAGAIVPIQFMNAIIAAKDALRADRKEIQKNYGAGHATRWASDWFFKMPEYDPTWCIFDNGGWEAHDLDTPGT